MDRTISPSSSSDAPPPAPAAGSDRILQAKATLGAVGIAVGILGMSLHRNAFVWAGAACLGAAFLLRFAPRR